MFIIGHLIMHFSNCFSRGVSWDSLVLGKENSSLNDVPRFTKHFYYNIVLTRSLWSLEKRAVQYRKQQQSTATMLVRWMLNNILFWKESWGVAYTETAFSLVAVTFYNLQFSRINYYIHQHLSYDFTNILVRLFECIKKKKKKK